LDVTETEIINEIGRRLAAAAPVGSRILLFGSRPEAKPTRGQTTMFWSLSRQSRTPLPSRRAFAPS
jgi:hypothetical protein